MSRTALARILTTLQQEGGLRVTDIAVLTNVPKTTVSRWLTGEASPHPQSERIISDLSYVVQKLRDFYKPETIRSWLHAKQPHLGGERAVDLIHASRTVEVLTVFARLDADAYI